MLSPRRSVAVHLEPFGTVRSRDLLDIGSCRGYPFLPEWPAFGPGPNRKGEQTVVKQRVLSGLAVVVLALVGASSAFAFDCIRVSSSLKGLQQSTKSGNWLLFDLSTPAAFQESLTEFGVALTDEQAACGSEAYAQSGQPLYFALGIGLAAGENENASAGGVLAHNNPNTSVLSNGKGIDHFEDSGIIPALEAAAATCGVPV